MKNNTVSDTNKKSLITKHMSIAEVVELYPSSIDVFLEYGLHCVGCGAAAWESVEDGAMGHGMSEELIDQLIEELNEMAVEQMSNIKKF
ncbi:DUF1858 domain-containing protein [Candidatus Peregrinibacteria bacterium]|jgi:hybrid cluster-associated redox disulfide protein|nr:DUF1858 domain-containing protein [Candidatus Peregrinibacteria bacterium]